MKSFLLLFAFCIQYVVSDNNDPIVLVHGLASDASAFQYYPELEESGLRTIRVEVNGFTSNHDRAAELYAQLKGTVVDYGVCHSRFYGHLRFGTDYTGKGMFPEWGENHKAHFFGHSMGGTTIRTLERLLEEGSNCDEDTSDLYTGNHNWITSISTIASPLDGTTFFDDMPGNDPVEVIESVISFTGWALGDTDFPQWGLVQGEDESFRQYWRRVKRSGLLESDDFSIYDLSIPGSEKFNSNGKQTYDGRYYYSFAAERTNSELVCENIFSCERIETPSLGMSLTLRRPALWLGISENEDDRKNDGAVNQIRARCPSNDNCKDVDINNMNWQTGRWHTVMIDYLDHFQVTDRDDRNDRRNYEKSAKKIYLEHGLRLKNLPSTSTRSSNATFIFEKKEMADALGRYVEVMRVLSDVEDIENAGINSANPIIGAILLVACVSSLTVFGVMVYRKKKTGSILSKKSAKEENLTAYTL